MQVFKEKFGIS